MKPDPDQEPQAARPIKRRSLLRSPFSLLRPRKGSSLVTALLVLVVLSTIVVAFMQSMSIERNVARSAANKLRADLAAQAGVREAENVLLTLFRDHPDSVTVWETISANATCTVAYFKNGLADTNVLDAGGRPNRPLTPAAQVFFRPLVSGAITNPDSFGNTAKSAALPPLNPTNSTDLNAFNPTLGRRLVGAMPGTAPVPMRAPWVEILDASNNLVARYAFLVEDESFKINVKTAGATQRGTASPGTNAADVSLIALFETLQAAGGNYSAIDPQDLANRLVASRNTAPGHGRLLEEGQINRIHPALPSLRQDLQFLVSQESGALNLSRHGSKRVNLNALVANSSDPVQVRRQTEAIASTIHYHMPRFGQRFYRTSADLNSDTQVSTNSPNHELAYLTKLAANIRDMIDSDSQPTVVNNDAARTVRLGTNAPSPLRAAGFPVGGSSAGNNDVLAYGKEAVPYLQEYAVRAKTVSMTPSRRSASAPTFATYNITIDHYFEFWNPGTKDITVADLGPNAYLSVYAQPAYDTAGGTDIPEGRDFRIPLADFVDGSGNPLVFRAGQATVLTTDATPASTLCPNPSSVFRPAAPDTYTDINGNSHRQFTGQTARVADGSPSSVNGWFRVNINPRSTSQTDYQTEVLLGNDLGIIESFCALPIPANLSINNDNNNRANTETFFFRGGSLRGNSANLNQVADPRTNAEQLFIQRYRSTGDEDQTRYYTSNLNNNNVPANSNFGNPINPFTTLANWPDPANSYAATAAGALSVNLDRPLVSIGELGHVFDPARGINSAAGGVNFSRGGGRTLRIGQSDNATMNPRGLWTGNRIDSSYERAAWRLTDIFATQDDLRLPGRININGAQRDRGTGLRALVKGFVFDNSPGADALTSGRTLNETNFVQEILNRLAPPDGNGTLTPDTVFWDRGALSELALFSSNSTLNGQNMANARDRSREEVVRRLIELICTKGDTFRIHSIGQAVRETSPGVVRVLSTSVMSTTVRLQPVFSPSLTESFNPDNPSELISRFRRPDRYEILSVQ